MSATVECMMSADSDLFLCFQSTDRMDAEIYDERRKDHISHFILRLAYCRS